MVDSRGRADSDSKIEKLNVVNADYFTANQPSPEATTEIGKKKKQDRKVWSILSIIATMIPILLWGFCEIVIATNGGDRSESGAGAIGWIMVMYYWTLGIPLAIISIAFGIVGLKTSLRWLSIVSLSLKAIIYFIFFIMLWR